MTPRGSNAIEIATFRVAVEIIGKDPEKWRPKTRETADHSLPYCTAVALVDGEISADSSVPSGFEIRRCSTWSRAPRSSKTPSSRPAIPRASPTA